MTAILYLIGNAVFTFSFLPLWLAIGVSELAFVLIYSYLDYKRYRGQYWGAFAVLFIGIFISYIFKEAIFVSAKQMIFSYALILISILANLVIFMKLQHLIFFKRSGISSFIACIVEVSIFYYLVLDVDAPLAALMQALFIRMCLIPIAAAFYSRRVGVFEKEIKTTLTS